MIGVHEPICGSGGRQLLDVRSKLQRNAENKFFTTQEAEHMQLEMMGQQSLNRVEVCV